MKNIDTIEALLPQTQCGLCGHGGCKPYATALAKGEDTIDKCPPGGLHTLQQLGNLLAIDPTPFVEDMTAKAKPALTARIREEECIGCTKCIQACPIDAIVGSGKLMHSVITDECSGCELCIEPCPVDCIELVTIEEPTLEVKAQRSAKYRQRFTARNERLEQLQQAREQRQAKATKLSQGDDELAAKRNEIAAALARVQAKRTKTT